MNRQFLAYTAIFVVLLTFAFFTNEFSQESDIKQALSEHCCTQQQLENFNLKLETTACYGSCPVYSLEITSDSALHVVGNHFVDFKEINKRLTKEQLISIGKLVYVSNYFDLENIYGYRGKGCTLIRTDQSSSIWSIEMGEEKHSIDYYKGCVDAPKELALFEKELIRRLGLELALLK